MYVFFFALRKYQEQLTSQYDDVGMRCERDAFDALFDCDPTKLAVVKKVITVLNGDKANFYKFFFSVIGHLCQ